LIGVVEYRYEFKILGLLQAKHGDFFDTPQPLGVGILCSQIQLAQTGLLSAKVEVESPKAFESLTQVSVCPTVLNANFRILTAAFQSLSVTSPHLQAWVLTDRDFLTIAPQLEHSPDV
jgi:hypothetical protein